MMLTMLADVARAAGLTVSEVPGWKTAGRPGGMLSVQTIVCHHTGGLKDLNTIIHGRSDLAGPLAHFFLARDGGVHVVAAGKCNHAGVVFKASYGNPNAIGIEAEATGVPGTAGDWPPEQMDAYARLCRALQLHFGLGVADVRGHKEVASPLGRKTDPDFDMLLFRNRVGKVDITPPKPPNPPEKNVPLTNADADLIWSHPNAIVKQSPAGALKTTLDRVDADNLQLQVRNGLADALADSQSPLSVRFVEIETKLDAILAILNPPA